MTTGLTKIAAILGISAIAGTAVFGTNSADAASQLRKHETRFSVSFAGIEIGKAVFRISFSDDSYSLEGEGKTSGLAEWFAPGRGKVTSSGDLIGNTLQPATHFASVTESSKKPETVKLVFQQEAVTKVEVQSAKKRKKRLPPKYVPLDASHLSRVLDPASSMIIPMSGRDAADGRKVCNQRFPIFDGETRYDIRLSYKQTKKITTSGYDGFAYVCRMRYVPVAGHKKNHRQVKEMADNKKMEIWLAPMGGVSVFTPIRIVVGTKYGRFNAEPTRFALLEND